MTPLHDKLAEQDLDEQTRVWLETLFEAHQQIAADIGQAQTAHGKDIDDYNAGQQEALNRVKNSSH